MSTTATSFDWQTRQVSNAGSLAYKHAYPKVARTTTNAEFYSRVSNATMNKNLVTISTESAPMLSQTQKTIRHTNNPEILAMSDDEYIAAIQALSGSCAGDGMEESIKAMNDVWKTKLENITDHARTDPFI